MGLDQYLTASKFVSTGSFYVDAAARQKSFNDILKSAGFDRADVGAESSMYVNVTVGYWRKANAIHGWFVRNVQNGADDCGTYYVSRENLETLRTVCKTILATVEYGEPIKHSATESPWESEAWEEKTVTAIDSKLVAETLPPTAGFFFGDSGIGAYYVQDLESTVEIIDRCLAAKSFEGSSFEYHSSW